LGKDVIHRELVVALGIAEAATATALLLLILSPVAPVLAPVATLPALLLSLCRTTL
jgi:hypothetical protein